MIRVDSLSVDYGAIHALADVTFEAATGEITAVLGSNGAGKTTLLRTISGLIKPRTGSITLDGHELIGEKTETIARLGVAHVPEGRGVIGSFTIEENLRLGALAARADLQAGLARQFELFPVLGERRRQPADTLSGGERQMLVMARALIANPRTLLLDEPSLGLAPLVTVDIMQTIAALCRDTGLTVVLVEQNAKSALKVAHRAVVLHLGSVVANDTADVVSANDQLKHYYLGLVR